MSAPSDPFRLLPDEVLDRMMAGGLAARAYAREHPGDPEALWHPNPAFGWALHWTRIYGDCAAHEVRRRAVAMAELDRSLPDVVLVDPDESPPDDAPGGSYETPA